MHYRGEPRLPNSSSRSKFWLPSFTYPYAACLSPHLLLTLWAAATLLCAQKQRDGEARRQGDAIDIPALEPCAELDSAVALGEPRW